MLKMCENRAIVVRNGYPSIIREDGTSFIWKVDVFGLTPCWSRSFFFGFDRPAGGLPSATTVAVRRLWWLRQNCAGSAQSLLLRRVVQSKTQWHSFGASTSGGRNPAQNFSGPGQALKNMTLWWLKNLSDADLFSHTKNSGCGSALFYPPSG